MLGFIFIEITFPNNNTLLSFKRISEESFDFDALQKNSSVMRPTNPMYMLLHYFRVGTYIYIYK